MRYLKTLRARIILLCFLVSSLVFVALPKIDLLVSSLFFDRGFPLARAGWTQFLHNAVGPAIVVALLATLGVYAFNRFRGQNVLGIDARKVAYLFLVLIVGAGLIVNASLKDNFGRVRPRNVQEFGGTGQFTPAFVVSNGCARNCSFSSGDAAGAFFFLAFAMAVSKRRSVAVAAVSFGVAVSFSRVAIGAHFLSDTLVSFFVMLTVADVLYFYMFVPAEEPEPQTAARPALGIEA